MALSEVSVDIVAEADEARFGALRPVGETVRYVAHHREVTEAGTGERSAETACGVTSLGSEAAAPKRLLELNRGQGDPGSI